MAATKNLCAQISLDLHQKISEAKEAAGLTTAQYITNLLTEYFTMKESGGRVFDGQRCGVCLLWPCFSDDAAELTVLSGYKKDSFLRILSSFKKEGALL